MARRPWLIPLAVACAATLTACYDKGVTGPATILNAPSNLQYQLEPSGAPTLPSGILLSWDAMSDPELEAYRVYSRPSTTAPYSLRGTTTSNTFHDNGVPHLQYYVTALSTSGGESAPSNSIEVDERLALPAPTTLASISLNGAIHLQWSDNAYASAPNDFSSYRVYSTSYDLNHNLCGNNWSLEGATVSPTFLVGVLVNGVPLCFAVSAISREGYESLWSPLRNDTPRPDARNVIVYAVNANAAASGFRFWLDANGNGLVDAGELGLVGSGASGTADFYVSHDTTGFYLVPQRAGTTMQVYGSTPVADLTSIDVAPNGGYSASGFQALPMWGYVFQMRNVTGFYSYGAVRVTATGSNYVILDWSYQTDAGNPELIVTRR